MTHPKGALIERAQKLGLAKPVFKTTSSGPDHDPTFVADVLIDGEVYGSGEGGNKKEAERAAAEEALQALEGQSPAPRQEYDEDDADDADDDYDEEMDEGSFEGPWPIFERVLASCLSIAHERTDGKLRGDEGREAVQAFALELYKRTLENLGDVVEVE